MTRNASPRTIFTSKGHNYEIYDTQVKHSDYDTLHLAWRTSVAGGRRTSVVMKPFPLSSDNERRERACEEVQIATYLQHPNIASVLGIVSQNDRTFYVVMENTQGLYLATVLDLGLVLGRKLSPAFAAYVAAMVADALTYVHGRSDSDGQPLHIIHRAVGPMSVRLGFDGGVKLTNFGSAYAKLRDRLPTRPGWLRGDAAYTAPEAWRAVMASSGPRLDPIMERAISGRADVFSLGLVLLEMLLGEYPLDPTDASPSLGRPGLTSEIKTERHTWITPNVLAARVLRFGASDVEQRSETLAKGLRDVVRSALEPDPDARCGAAEMRDGLLKFLSGLEHPYGPQEAGNEVKDIYNGAKRVKRLLARPTERTALPREEDDVP